MSRVVIVNNCRYHVKSMVTLRKHSGASATAGEQAWELLFQLFRDVRANMITVSADFELTLAQARLLQDLNPGHPVPMTELASAQRCDASNITGLGGKLGG